MRANLVLLSDSRIWHALPEQNTLNTLRLDISFKNLQKIENKRKEAVKKGLLVSSKEDFVKAEISSHKEKHACKVRLKGDLSDHWSGQKFSLRVEIKGEGLFNGMSRFSLQDPITRLNTSEWLFLNSLKRESLMAVRYDFVNLIINGKQMGIYAIEEHFSKEMIESNQRREGVIVNWDDFLLWKKFPNDKASNIEWNSIFRSAKVETKNSKRINNNPMLKRQAGTATNLLRSIQENNMPASKIFDSEKTGKFLAMTRIWNAERGLLFADINFYFNPVTCLLEPIGFDGNSLDEDKAPYCYFSHGDIKDNWVNFALTDHRIASSYTKNLYLFTRDEYLKDLREDLGKKERFFRNLLLKEKVFTNPEIIWQNYSSLLKYLPWQSLQRRAKFVQTELNEEQIINAYGKTDNKNALLELTIRNSTTQPVQLLGFQKGSTNLDPINLTIFPKFKNLWLLDDNLSVILPGQGNGFRQTEHDHRFKINTNMVSKRMDSNASLVALVRFLGMPTDIIKIPIPVDYFAFNNSSLPTFHKSRLDYPSTFLKRKNGLFVPEGVHKIKQKIFIPYDQKLFVEPGAKLYFEENCTIVSNGQLHFQGKEDNPIIVSSKESFWPGLLLFNCSDKSVFEHAMFSRVLGVGEGPNPHGMLNNGWTMTGGINIHESPVIFKNCTFSNFRTEDALNIISSSFILENCRFSQTYSDAFDGDFVTGEIQNCQFEDIGGDGIDFSGSNAKITDCNFVKIFDKAISVGEASKVDILNSAIDGAAFGVVSKDSSSTTIHNSTLQNITKSAFSVYQKKNSFGPAQLKVIESKIFTAEKDFLIQDNSKAWNNGKAIPTVPININTLYAD